MRNILLIIICFCIPSHAYNFLTKDTTFIDSSLIPCSGSPGKISIHIISTFEDSQVIGVGVSGWLNPYSNPYGTFYITSAKNKDTALAFINDTGKWYKQTYNYNLPVRQFYYAGCDYCVPMLNVQYWVTSLSDSNINIFEENHKKIKK